MTITELKTLDKAVLTAEEVAPYLAWDPQALRITARKNPEWLPIPVAVIGARTYFPRLQLIHYLERSA